MHRHSKASPSGRGLRALATLALLAVGAAPPAVSTAPALGQPASRPSVAPVGNPAQRPKEFDYSEYNTLLARYVRGGLVDYAAWKKDGAGPLDAVLEKMAAYPQSKVFAHEVRQAFLVNVYNAYVLQSILKAYPVKSVKDIPGFFDKTKHALDDGSYTLDEIEKTLILPRFDGNPGYHFAIVCGAMGCPRLRNRAYAADSLTTQLGMQLQAFATDSTRCQYVADRNVLRLSELFQWSRKEIEKGDMTLPRFLSPYFSLGVAMKFMKEEPPLEFIPFDWTLNDAGPAGGAK